jgi:hypothetical protein
MLKKLAVATVLGTMIMAVPVNAQMITAKQVEQKRAKDRERLLKLTPEHFAQTITFDDDDLQTVATLSTEKGFRTPHGLFDIQGADIFLRAHVGKKEGETSYQVYLESFYQATSTRDYTSANFLVDGEVQSAKLITLSNRTVKCEQYSDVLGCTRAETVTFIVSEAALRAAAALPQGTFWRIKFRARAGDDWEDQIAPAEAAGLLAAIDAFKAKRGIKVM